MRKKRVNWTISSDVLRIIDQIVEQANRTGKKHSRSSIVEYLIRRTKSPLEILIEKRKEAIKEVNALTDEINYLEGLETQRKSIIIKT